MTPMERFNTDVWLILIIGSAFWTALIIVALYFYANFVDKILP